MIEMFFDGLGVAGLWLAIQCCLKQQTAESLEEASLIPFADDPEVARRVELASGKSGESGCAGSGKARLGESGYVINRKLE